MKLNTYLNESINDVGIFKAAFIAGQPGAGKTYISSKMKGVVEPRIVNIDKFYKLFNDKNTFLNRAETLTKKQLYFYLNNMLPIIIDSTASNLEDTIRRAGLLSGIGYDVDAMVFVNSTLETSLNRVQLRSRKVDPEYILSVYTIVNKARNYYHTKFPIFIEIMNDVGELNDKILIKAYKKLTSYFLSDIKNPLGIKNKEILMKTKQKTLVPTIFTESHLKHLVEMWFK